jgi:Tfp pilus assembly protein PilN
MVSTNLLPPSLVRQRAVRRRMRAWGGVVACALGAIAVPVVMHQTARAQERSLLARRDAIDGHRSSLQRELAQGIRSIQSLQTQLARADALRSKRPWSALFGMISACMPEGTWLTLLATDAPGPSPTRTAARVGKAAEPDDSDKTVRMEGATGLTLQGFAVDHGDLYAFMSRLKATNLFADVELIRSGREPVLDGQAVRFELRCTW